MQAGIVTFVTEFVIWGKNLPSYDVRENSFTHGGISKQISLDHFST